MMTDAQGCDREAWHSALRAYVATLWPDAPADVRELIVNNLTSFVEDSLGLVEEHVRGAAPRQSAPPGRVMSHREAEHLIADLGEAYRRYAGLFVEVVQRRAWLAVGFAGASELALRRFAQMPQLRDGLWDVDHAPGRAEAIDALPPVRRRRRWWLRFFWP